MPLFLSAAYLIELTLVPVTVRSCAACDMSHTSRLHCAICGRALPLILKYQSLQQQGKLTKREKKEEHRHALILVQSARTLSAALP